MLETTFFYAALTGGIVLLFQFAMMFLGGGEDDFDAADADLDAGGDFDMDADGSHHGDAAGYWFFEMVSLRTLAAAATFFGLVGMTARSADIAPPIALTLATGAGFAAMYAVYWMFKQLLKLQSSGAQRIRNAVGLPGQVYLRIPGKNEGTGKVHLTMQQRTVEYLAVTDEPEGIPTGENVWVVDIVNGETLRVAREDSLSISPQAPANTPTT